MAITCRCLEVTSRIVALRDKDVVIDATFEGFVQGDSGAHEHLLNLSEPVEAGLKLEMMICFPFGNCRDNSNVVALRADVMRGGNDCDIDI